MNIQPHVYRISELNEAVRDMLETAFSQVSVTGEISNLARPASGHLYFSLKDDHAAVSCALFKGSRFRVKLPWSEIANGLHVRAQGRVSLYTPRGQYQLILDVIEPAGLGRLEREYQQRLQRLSTEGLFAEARKRPLPAQPRCIGIITSTSGAAVHDALTTLARRNPALSVVLYPALVQGQEAAAQLCAQLHTANRRKDCDLLLLIRGGGSLEDLWAFNDESLVRAIVASEIPVISGIGHEIDVTLSDFAADLRAATPTAAAELVCPAFVEQRSRLMQRLHQTTSRLLSVCAAQQQKLTTLTYRLSKISPQHQLQTRIQRCDEWQARLQTAYQYLLLARQDTVRFLGRRLFSASPTRDIERNKTALHTQQTRLCRAMTTQLQQKRQRVEFLCQSMAHLNPLAVCSRGYALVRDETGRIICRASDVAPKSRIRVALAEGQLYCTVERRKLH